MPDLFCFVGFLLYFLKSLSQPMSFLTSALPVLTPTVGGCVGLSCQLGNNHDSLLLKSTHGMDLQLSSTTAPETFQIHPKRFTNISRGKPDHWAASGKGLSPHYTAVPPQQQPKSHQRAQCVHPQALGWSDPCVCVLSVG